MALPAPPQPQPQPQPQQQQAIQQQTTRPSLPPLTCDDLCIVILLKHICQSDPSTRSDGLRFLFNIIRNNQSEGFSGTTLEILQSSRWGQVIRSSLNYTPEDLLGLIAQLRQFLSPTKQRFYLDSTSPLGNTARRIVLSLERATFAKICDLLQTLRAAISATTSSTRDDSSQQQQLEHVIHSMAQDVLPSMLRSPKLCEIYTFLQGAPIPSLLSSVKWHFIKALEAVERNDLPGAMEALYVYYDCFGPLSATTGDHQVQKTASHVGFASLAIASFLLRLRSDDSIPAVHEAIRLGLERGDSYLVALALYRFIIAALDSGMLQVPQPLLSQLLSQAGSLATRRPLGTLPPASASEQTVLHSILSTCIQLQWPDLSTIQDALTSLAEAAKNIALPSSTAPQEATSTVLHHQRRALRAIVWDRAGNSLLAETYWRASLPPLKHIPALQRSVAESELTNWEASHMRLSDAIASCSKQLGNGDPGLYMVLPAFEPTTRCALRLATESALARGALDEACLVASQLRGITPAQVLPVEHLYAAQMEARALLLKDQPENAAALLAATEKAVRKHWPHRGDINLALIGFSLELARAGHPAAALPIVLQALAAAEMWQTRGPLHTEASLALVQVMILMDLKRAHCRSLVEEILPQALQHGCHRLVASTWLTLARATLSQDASPETLASALQQLDRALEAASSAADQNLCADIYYLRARVFHQLGREQDRNEASRLFKIAIERKNQRDPIIVCQSNIRALAGQMQVLSELLRSSGA